MAIYAVNFADRDATSNLIEDVVSDDRVGSRAAQENVEDSP
ncbi:MAG: hypothetical protein AAF322_01390 [Pseudomonadota bacterium]